MVSYSAINFDKTAIIEGLLNNNVVELENWERRIQFDPIHQLKKRFVLKPMMTFGLKQISKLFGFDLYEKEGVADLDGFAVGMAYEEYTRSRKKKKVFPVEMYKTYNVVDVKALIFVIKKMKELNDGSTFDFYSDFNPNYFKNEENIAYPNEKVKEFVVRRIDKKESENKTKEYTELSIKLDVSEEILRRIGLSTAMSFQSKEDLMNALENKTIDKNKMYNHKRVTELRHLSEKLNASQRQIKKIGVAEARKCNSAEEFSELLNKFNNSK